MARSIQTWNALSESYRSRLERNGITRSRYVSGDRLTGARGHAQTPERPERATRNPQRYPQYVEKHSIGKITGGGNIGPTADVVYQHVKTILLDEFANDRIEKIDVSEIKQYINKADPVTRMRMLSMTGEQYREQASIQQPWAAKKPARSWFVKIGDHWYNPFWYH